MHAFCLHNTHDFRNATLMATSRWFREEFVFKLRTVDTMRRLSVP